MQNNLQIGLIGLGNVGLQVAKELVNNKDLENHFFLNSILVRNVNKYNKIIDNDPEFLGNSSMIKNLLTENPKDFFKGNFDVVVELIGGLNPAKEYVKTALLEKKHVVTANKELIANHFSELIKIAKSNKMKLRFEGSVGAGIPVIEVLTDMLKQNSISRITGIINGTSNYILSSMYDYSADFSKVLLEAQKLGFAESDPTDDIDGHDAKYKIDILGSIAFGGEIPLNNVSVKGIRDISLKDISHAKNFGYTIKLLAITERNANLISSRVSPALVPLSHPLANVNENYNAIEIVGNLVGNLWIQGEGAGKKSTASAILGDLMGIYNSSSGDVELSESSLDFMNDLEIKYKNYLRLSVSDEFGVLAKIAGIFSTNKISIASVMQNDPKDLIEEVDLVIMTHASPEKYFIKAMEQIESLSVVRNKPISIRIHE